MIPRCTFRVQLHADFGFDDAAAIVEYLARLGVSHLYCSPYLQAAQGSTHGYDVLDHSRLNEELGGADAHGRLTEVLGAHGLGQVLDIVPNHMARDGRANRWWWDVLENGPASRYAGYFDIDWVGGEDKSEQTVLVPILGDHYGRVLEAGELHLDRERGGFLLRYHEHELPLSPRTLDDLLAAAAERAQSAPLRALAEDFGVLPHARRTDPAAVAHRHERKQALQEALRDVLERDPRVAGAVDEELKSRSADADLLDALLRRQNYRLAFWRTAGEELDYRRFFNIETLLGLRAEDEEVFAETHRLILDLVQRGTVQGLRIDHVDGLADPEGYLHRLRRAAGGAWTVVEKILEPGEDLPADWPVEGTSGYDFVTRVNNLFVDIANEAAMTACYEGFTGEETPYAEVVQVAKQQIMREELAAEIERLTRALAQVCDGHRRHRDHTRRELRDALRETIAAFGVYRTYVQPDRAVSEADRVHVREALEKARERRPDVDAELLEFLGELLLLAHPGAAETDFAVRFAQVSAPVMAKGVEDTAFYRYHRLISLNEVGGDPGVFGRPLAAFHEDCARTAAAWPGAMLTLSTHDTKRSADVRARINLLSEIPAAWECAATRWSRANERHRAGQFPDRNAEYLLYQTLVGAWPVSTERVLAFVEKASKEAKVHTSWVDPAPDYDEALASFVAAVLADDAFVEDLEQFLDAHRLVELGRVNSLAQTALLLTCPGVPDLYQGGEGWDYSLVDPDNRRPVDYSAHGALLEELASPGASVEDAWALSEQGGPKMWLIRRLLGHRREHPALYQTGAYEPLPVAGTRAGHAVAFLRGADLAVVVPRLAAGLDEDWGDTTVTLPAGRWSDLLGDGAASVDRGSRPLAELTEHFPVVVLTRTES